MLNYQRVHTYIVHRYIFIYIYIHIYTCVCVIKHKKCGALLPAQRKASLEPVIAL